MNSPPMLVSFSGDEVGDVDPWPYLFSEHGGGGCATLPPHQASSFVLQTHVLKKNTIGLSRVNTSWSRADIVLYQKRILGVFLGGVPTQRALLRLSNEIPKTMPQKAETLSHPNKGT